MFSRQIKFIGKQGQSKIEQASIAIIGVGALGSVAAELLVRSGVKNILLIDRDVVELSNLQRQLFSKRDIGTSKVVAMKEKLLNISAINIEISAIHLNYENINMLNNYNLILDCTDNLTTRFLINDYCKKNKKTWIYSSAIKDKGFVMPIFPDSNCLQCFLKEASLDTCSTAGVLNTTTSLIAALQTNLALKIILEKEIDKKLLSINLENNEIKKLTIKKNENCQTCKGNYVYLENKRNNLQQINFCGAERFYFPKNNLTFEQIKTRWNSVNFQEDEATIRFKGITFFKDGHAIIKAENKQAAEIKYSKFIGN